MAFQMRNNTGTAFRNDRKTKETHPDYRGSALVDGVELWMAVWFREAGPESQIAGQEYMSMAFNPKDGSEIDKSKYRGAAFDSDFAGQPGEPDMSGPCTINGKDFTVNVREKEAGPNAKNPGLKYYSMTFQLAMTPDQKSLAKEAQKEYQQPGFGGDFDDDIPF